jgi:hypothetical protein
VAFALNTASSPPGSRLAHESETHIMHRPAHDLGQSSMVYRGVLLIGDLISRAGLMASVIGSSFSQFKLEQVLPVLRRTKKPAQVQFFCSRSEIVQDPRSKIQDKSKTLALRSDAPRIHACATPQTLVVAYRAVLFCCSKTHTETQLCCVSD